MSKYLQHQELNLLHLQYNTFSHYSLMCNNLNSLKSPDAQLIYLNVLLTVHSDGKPKKQLNHKPDNPFSHQLEHLKTWCDMKCKMQSEKPNACIQSPILDLSKKYPQWIRTNSIFWAHKLTLRSFFFYSKGSR